MHWKMVGTNVIHYEKVYCTPRVSAWLNVPLMWFGVAVVVSAFVVAMVVGVEMEEVLVTSSAYMLCLRSWT